MMKKLFISFLIICLLFSALCGCGTKNPSTEIDTQNAVFSSFTTTDMEDNIVSEEIFADKKVTLVNVWGTFCGPCIKEMPDLAELNKKYSDKGFQVIGIPTDVVDKNFVSDFEKYNEAKTIITTTGADYVQLIPSKSLNKTYLSTVQTLPQTIFVNCKGEQIGKTYFGAKTKSEWEKIIKYLLENVK